MKKYFMTILSFVPIVVGFILSITLLYGDKLVESEGFYVEGIISIIVAAITVIGSIIAAVINTNAIKDKQLALIKSLIGDSNAENYNALLYQVGVKKNKQSIAEQLGVHNNSKSITGQISDLSIKIDSDKIDKAEKFKHFKQKQKDTIQKVEEISDFLKDWENLNIENEKIKQAYTELHAENARLLQRVNALEDEMEHDR